MPLPNAIIKHGPERDALDTLLEMYIEGVNEHVESMDEPYNYDYEIDDIETEHVPGFIPYTQGGKKLTRYATISGAWGSGNGPAKARDIADSCLADFRNEFERDNPGFNLDAVQDLAWKVYRKEATPTDEQQAQLDKLSDYENAESEYLSEGGVYFYFITAQLYSPDNWRNPHPDKKACVLFRAVVNMDLDYGREFVSYGGGNQNAAEFESCVALPELNKAEIDKAIKGAGDMLTRAAKGESE